MWLNQQTVDAIRVMAELATHWPNRIRASDLPEPTGISFVNIQKTVHALGVATLAETQRGRQGGIRLARAPEAIDIGEMCGLSRSDRMDSTAAPPREQERARDCAHHGRIAQHGIEVAAR